MGPYDRPVRGADVLARAAASGADPALRERIACAVDPEREVAGIEALAAIAGPERLGMSPGSWSSVFGPLFGEFE